MDGFGYPSCCCLCCGFLQSFPGGVEVDDRRAVPSSLAAAEALRVCGTGSFVGATPGFKDGKVIAVVAVRRSDETDGTMQMLGVVQLHTKVIKRPMFAASCTDGIHFTGRR